MWIVRLVCDNEEREALAAELWDRDTEGITETASGCEAFFATEEAARAAAAALPQYDPAVEPAPVQDWTAQWNESWPSLAIGAKFFLVPDWRDDPVPPGRIRLTVHPGQAFGTGAHPTTQAMLMAMEEISFAGRLVLDLGTGAGVLAVAARLLGAQRVTGCDTDELSVQVAAGNCAQDGAPAGLFVGSIDTVRDASVDILLANILPEVHVALAGEYRRTVKPGGWLLLSGFEEYEAGAVQQALGLELQATAGVETWRVHVYRR